MSSSTKMQQQKTVDEGLALGVIMLGIEGVNSNKANLELDCRRAWRSWDHAYLFPAIRTGPAFDDVLHLLYRSARRRGPRVVRWEGAWPFRPVLLVDDWSADEIAELIDDDVPAKSWASLARGWLNAGEEE